MLEVRHFHMIKAIAATGSVTRAAKQLHLTQPAVSHRLRGLEKRLGTALFRRDPRRMILTREGERVLAAGEVILREVHEVESDLGLLGNGRQRAVRISTECYTCYHWLPPVLKYFSEKFPKVDVQILPEASSDPLQALVDQCLDVAIVHSAVRHPALIAEELFDDELVAVLPKDHPLARRRWLEPSDFDGQILLLHRDAQDSLVMSQVLLPAGVTPARVTELQLTEALVQAVKAGFGMTVMARWAVQPELDRGELVGVPIGPEGLSRSWRMVTRRDVRHRASVQELARLLKYGSPAESDFGTMHGPHVKVAEG